MLDQNTKVNYNEFIKTSKRNGEVNMQLLKLIARKNKTQSVFAQPDHKIEIINIGDNVVCIDGDFLRRGKLTEINGEWGKIEYVRADGSTFQTWLTASYVFKLRGKQAEIDALPHATRFDVAMAFLR